MRRTVATVLAVVCCGIGLAGCESGDERLVREYAECMVDDNSMLYRQMSSGETGTVPLSVAGAEVWVRAQLERGELTMAKLGESYARFCR